jgi:hypothetical protein
MRMIRQSAQEKAQNAFLLNDLVLGRSDGRIHAQRALGD